MSLPYSPIGQPRRMALTLAMLAAVAVSPVAGLESVAAAYKVPDGSMLTLLHDQPVRLYLQARREQTRGAGAAGSFVDVVVQVNGDGRRLIQSSRAQRSFPSTHHPDVIAFTQVTGQDWQRATVQSVDWETGAVTVSTPNNAGRVRVYYTFGDGEISLRASRPQGSSSGSIHLWKGTARGLHETDQTDRDTAPYLARRPLPIPQGFSLQLVVRASSAVYFDGLAAHEVMIPVTDTGIQVMNPVQLADLAEMQLKGV